MKLTFLLLFFFSVQAKAIGYLQGITINKTNSSLEEVLLEVNRQTGYLYSINNSILRDAKKIDIHVDGASLKQVLAICLKDQGLIYSIKDNIIIIKREYNRSGTASEYINIDVSGRLINEKGQAVSATVSVKGTSIAVSTDAEGYFLLKSIDEESIISITGVNIETLEIKVLGRPNLGVLNLKTKIVEVGEVKVANTGYQKINPTKTTGSVFVIDNETFNQQKGTNVLQRLNGVTPGFYLNIGKTSSVSGGVPFKTKISIRGLSTINGVLDPLIVLDNFIYDGNIDDINPNDVENITILKDAAATSIYGAKGGNGVIVIETKKGRFGQKFGMGISSNLIITEKPDTYYLPQISVNDYIDVEEYLFNKGFFNSQINSSARPGLTPAVEVFLKRRNGLINAADSATGINSLKSLDSRKQYDKYFIQNPITQQHSISLTGGTTNLAWLISGAYDKSISSSDNVSNRINLRFNNTYRPIKNLQINLGVYYIRSKSTSGKPAYNSVKVNNREVPYLRFDDDNGNAIPLNVFLRGAYTDTAGAGKLLNWKYYPLEDYKHDKSVSTAENILANVGLSYQILKGLSIDFKYQYQIYKSLSENFADLESFKARNEINRFSQLNRTSGIVTYIVPKGGILTTANGRSNSQNFRGQVDFNKEWNNHAISAIAGGEIRESITSPNTVVTVYGYNKDPLSVGNVDYVNTYPTFTGGSSTISGRPIIGNTEIYRFVSAYSNTSYTYKQRYSASLSVRKDASNTFGLESNDKWNPFWHVGLAWDLAKEDFYKISVLPNFKIKATYGYSGNVDVSRTALAILTYNSTTSTNTNFPFARINTLNNPELRWEKSRQLNIGVDFSTKNQIIAGSIDFYYKKGTDLYGPSSLDYTTSGMNTIVKNVANMEGKGIDIFIQSKNIDKSFKWSTGLIFNYNTNKTTEYYSQDSKIGYDLIGNGNSIYPVVGKPLYAIAAFKWGGLNGVGDPQGYLNGQLSTDYAAMFIESGQKGIYDGNMVYIGPSNPRYFGSLINTFILGRFSASINISYKLDYYFQKPTLSYSSLYNNGIGHKDFAMRWKKPGDELLTNVPNMVYTNYPQFTNRDFFYANSEINVLKGDHVRIQYINLTYSVPMGKRAYFIKRVQASCNIANLGIIWRANEEKIDPDYPVSIPLSKQFSIGLNAYFFCDASLWDSNESPNDNIFSY